MPWLLESSLCESARHDDWNPLRQYRDELGALFVVEGSKPHPMLLDLVIGQR